MFIKGSRKILPNNTLSLGTAVNIYTHVELVCMWIEDVWHTKAVTVVQWASAMSKKNCCWSLLVTCAVQRATWWHDALWNGLQPIEFSASHLIRAAIWWHNGEGSRFPLSARLSSIPHDFCLAWSNNQRIFLYTAFTALSFLEMCEVQQSTIAAIASSHFLHGHQMVPSPLSTFTGDWRWPWFRERLGWWSHNWSTNVLFLNWPASRDLFVSPCNCLSMSQSYYDWWCHFHVLIL